LSFPNDIDEAESFGDAVDVELGIGKGGMAIVLRPLGFAKTTVEAAGGPVSDTIDDTVRLARASEGVKILPHFDGERLTTVRDFLPADDLVGNFLDARGSRTVGFTEVAWVNGRKAAEKFGHVAKVADDSGSLDRPTKHSVAGG
jgi:hypothetical protein